MDRHTDTLSQRRRKCRTEIRRFARYLLVGAGNTAVDWVCYFFLTALFSVPAWAAQPVGYAAGAVNSYALNRKVTFHTTQRFFSRELLRFALLTLFTALASSLLMVLVTVRWGFTGTLLKDLGAKVGVTAFTMLFNFSFSRLWVFRGGMEEGTI
ncbi:MAG: GtrA family protein [Clostridiales bacterium]|nr:GtrA family protein [Clostridiales bacterium]